MIIVYVFGVLAVCNQLLFVFAILFKMSVLHNNCRCLRRFFLRHAQLLYRSLSTASFLFACGKMGAVFWVTSFPLKMRGSSVEDGNLFPINTTTVMQKLSPPNTTEFRCAALKPLPSSVTHLTQRGGTACDGWKVDCARTCQTYVSRTAVTLSPTFLLSAVYISMLCYEAAYAAASTRGSDADAEEDAEEDAKGVASNLLNSKDEGGEEGEPNELSDPLLPPTRSENDIESESESKSESKSESEGEIEGANEDGSGNTSEDGSAQSESSLLTKSQSRGRSNPSFRTSTRREKRTLNCMSEAFPDLSAFFKYVLQVGRCTHTPTLHGNNPMIHSSSAGVGGV